jgi:hypothetical protein
MVRELVASVIPWSLGSVGTSDSISAQLNGTASLPNAEAIVAEVEFAYRELTGPFSESSTAREKEFVDSLLSLLNRPEYRTLHSLEPNFRAAAVVAFDTLHALRSRLIEKHRRTSPLDYVVGGREARVGSVEHLRKTLAESVKRSEVERGDPQFLAMLTLLEATSARWEALKQPKSQQRR